MWVNKSRRMGWEGHLAVWERRELHRGFWWAHKEDRVCMEDLGIRWQDNIQTVNSRLLDIGHDIWPRTGTNVGLL
jgi:hypothetical protein